MNAEQLKAVMAIVDEPLSDGTTLRDYAKITTSLQEMIDGAGISVNFSIPRGTTMPPDATARFERITAVVNGRDA